MSLLPYSCTTLTLTKRLEKTKLWDIYTRMLCWINLEAACYKTAAVLPPTFHLTNHQSKTNKHEGHCLGNSNELIRNLPLWTPIRGLISLGPRAKTYSHLNADTWCSLEDLLRKIADRDRWRGKVCVCVWERERDIERERERECVCVC